MVSLDKLLEKQHGNCFYCRQHLPRELASRDHLQAASLDGSNAEGNLVACCTGINQKFGAMTVKEKMDIALQGVPAGWCSCSATQQCNSPAGARGGRTTAAVIALPVSRKRSTVPVAPQQASAPKASSPVVMAHVRRVDAQIKRALAKGQNLPTRRDKLSNWLELNAKVPKPLVSSVMSVLQSHRASRPEALQNDRAPDVGDALLRKLVLAAKHQVLPKSVLALHRWLASAVGPDAAPEGYKLLSQHRLVRREAGRLEVDVPRAVVLLDLSASRQGVPLAA